MRRKVKKVKSVNSFRFSGRTAPAQTSSKFSGSSSVLMTRGDTTSRVVCPAGYGAHFRFAVLGGIEAKGAHRRADICAYQFFLTVFFFYEYTPTLFSPVVSS